MQALINRVFSPASDNKNMSFDTLIVHLSQQRAGDRDAGVNLLAEQGQGKCHLAHGYLRSQFEQRSISMQRLTSLSWWDVMHLQNIIHSDAWQSNFSLSDKDMLMTMESEDLMMLSTQIDAVAKYIDVAGLSMSQFVMRMTQPAPNQPMAVNIRKPLRTRIESATPFPTVICELVRTYVGDDPSLADMPLLFNRYGDIVNPEIRLSIIAALGTPDFNPKKKARIFFNREQYAVDLYRLRKSRFETADDSTNWVNSYGHYRYALNDILTETRQQFGNIHLQKICLCDINHGLTTLNLSRTIATNARFANVTLHQTNLDDSDLSNANFSESHIYSSSLYNSKVFGIAWVNVDFHKAESSNIQSDDPNFLRFLRKHSKNPTLEVTFYSKHSNECIVS